MFKRLNELVIFSVVIFIFLFFFSSKFVIITCNKMSNEEKNFYFLLQNTIFLFFFDKQKTSWWMIRFLYFSLSFLIGKIRNKPNEQNETRRWIEISIWMNMVAWGHMAAFIQMNWSGKMVGEVNGCHLSLASVDFHLVLAWATECICYVLAINSAGRAHTRTIIKLAR